MTRVLGWRSNPEVPRGKVSACRGPGQVPVCSFAAWSPAHSPAPWALADLVAEVRQGTAWPDAQCPLSFPGAGRCRSGARDRRPRAGPRSHEERPARTRGGGRDEGLSGYKDPVPWGPFPPSGPRVTPGQLLLQEGFFLRFKNVHNTVSIVCVSTATLKDSPSRAVQHDTLLLLFPTGGWGRRPWAADLSSEGPPAADPSAPRVSHARAAVWGDQRTLGGRLLKKQRWDERVLGPAGAGEAAPKSGLRREPLRSRRALDL